MSGGEEDRLNWWGRFTAQAAELEIRLAQTGFDRTETDSRGRELLEDALASIRDAKRALRLRSAGRAEPGERLLPRAPERPAFLRALMRLDPPGGDFRYDVGAYAIVWREERRVSVPGWPRTTVPTFYYGAAVTLVAREDQGAVRRQLFDKGLQYERHRLLCPVYGLPPRGDGSPRVLPLDVHLTDASDMEADGTPWRLTFGVSSSPDLTAALREAEGE